MKGQIYKKNTLSFLVKLEDNSFLEVYARGNLKRGDNFLYVGDYVEVNIEEKIIERIFERKNILLRPYVSNVDAIFIVISKIPSPNFLVIDKQIIVANKENIPVYIVINKVDLKNSEKLIKKIREEYFSICPIIEISAEKKIGIEKLKDKFENKLIVLSGQSAVGKSSIIKVLSEKNIKIGEISKKNQKGKNTTRMIEIYDIDSTRIIDTCGFSSFELENIEKKDLHKYYKDFIIYSKKCWFNDCTHTNEIDCNIKKEVENGIINKERYLRYLQILDSIKEKEYY